MKVGVPEQALAELPKIELHVHLETSLRLRQLAERAHLDPISEPYLVSDPNRYSGYDRLRRLRYVSRTGKVPDILYTPENIATITYELLRDAAQQNVRYLELRVGGRRGFVLLGVRGMLEAVAEGQRRARREFGIQSRTIVTLVRERGPEAAAEVAEAVAECAHSCGVVGIDIAGDEENFPPILFKRTCEIAREAGLGITVHAGEFSGPASVWTSIYQLGATRIGHGLRAVEDPNLVAYLRDHRITLEICPTSNLRLGVVTSLREHPLRRLYEAGVPVTVNSDDPLLLGTSLTLELRKVSRELCFTLEDLRRLMQFAAEAAFDRRTALEAFGATAR